MKRRHVIDRYWIRLAVDSWKGGGLGGDLEGEDGGHGSGNWGHKGRPGLRGGSGNGKEGWTEGAGKGLGGNQYRGGTETNYYSSKKDWLNSLRGERQHEVQKWMESKGKNLAEQEKNILTSGKKDDIMKMLQAKAEARGYDDNFAKLVKNLDEDERKYLSDISAKSEFGDLSLENLMNAGTAEEQKVTANILNKLMGGDNFAGDVPQSESGSEHQPAPKIDPNADPENADPLDVKDVLDQKKLAMNDALNEYKKHMGTYLNPDPERKIYENAFLDAKAEYQMYLNEARKNPEYLDKIYVSESRKRLEAKGVENRPPQKYTTEMPEEAIIDRLGGGDKTQGSCASLALAYAACKAGYDVLDFRDGESRKEFSNHYYDTIQMEGADTTVHQKYVGEIPNGKAALRSLEPGKEYILTVGRHAAVVRLAENGKPQYLELQSATKNGWTYFNGNPGYTLSQRFGASGNGKAHTTEISQFASHPEFMKLIGYINTAADKQRKGSSGTIK